MLLKGKGMRWLGVWGLRLVELRVGGLLAWNPQL